MATAKVSFAQESAPALAAAESGARGASEAAAALPNGFSVDLEDAATLLWQRISGEWTAPGPALERQVEWLLETLSAAGASATFFTVADLARHRPHLIRRIVEAGHEIGCHGLFHDTLEGSSEAAFRSDVRAARAILADVSGRPIEGYRAPFFSLRPEMGWAHCVLAEEGYRYDASAVGAAPGLPRRLPGGLWESPLSGVRWWGRSWPCGGAWLAALPAGAAACAAGGGTVFDMHPYNVGWNRLGRAGRRSPRALWLRWRHEQVHNLLASRFRSRLAELLGRGAASPSRIWCRLQSLADYFDATAGGLARLYDGEGLFSRSFDRAARGALFEYRDLLLAECGDVAGLGVLDVGCGPGFHLEALAARGAAATGIDLSRAMVAAAGARLRGAGLEATLVQGDARTTALGRHDIVIAIGVFDYVEDAQDFMRVLAAAARSKVIATFPTASPVWTRVRRWRYGRRGIALRFYEAAEVEALAAGAGLAVRRIETVSKSGGGLFLSADVAESSGKDSAQ